MSAQPQPDKTQVQALILGHLAQLDALRGAGVPAATLQQRAWLKGWQVRRLADTHQALLDSQRFGPAARFFLEDLYGPKDHRTRDQDLARVLPKLLKLLPQSAQWTLAQALHMDVISEALDAQMAQWLSNHGALQSEGDLDAGRYGQAYRTVGHAEQREEQLSLVLQIGRSLDQLTRLPLLAASLKLMKKPAELAGLSELHAFLQRGFTAFAHMKGAEDFLQAIVQEERAQMLSWLRP